MKIEVANDHQIFCGMMNILQKLLKLFKKGCSTGGRWSIYIQKVKGFFVKGYLEEEIFKGDAGLCWNYGRIQSIFDKKAQSSTAMDLLWLLIEIVAWWGDFRQICTCGVRSNPCLGHGEEISVIIRNKLCDRRIFIVY